MKIITYFLYLYTVDSLYNGLLGTENLFHYIEFPLYRVFFKQRSLTHSNPLQRIFAAGHLIALFPIDCIFWRFFLLLLVQLGCYRSKISMGRTFIVNFMFTRTAAANIRCRVMEQKNMRGLLAKEMKKRSGFEWVNNL